MTLSDDMTSKTNWTQEEIDGLKKKYSRTHFTHFTMPQPLRKQRVKYIKGVKHVWMFGAWRLPQKREKRRRGAEVKNDDS